mmetsp:Transcript_19638/g.40407  ORF Transcript_19638/g.40407 Transcript_19638/m.40407 type:complete len:235 (+) Transcript_19638:2703-3407(+)
MVRNQKHVPTFVLDLQLFFGFLEDVFGQLFVTHCSDHWIVQIAFGNYGASRDVFHLREILFEIFVSIFGIDSLRVRSLSPRWHVSIRVPTTNDCQVCWFNIREGRLPRVFFSKVIQLFLRRVWHDNKHLGAPRMFSPPGVRHCTWSKMDGRIELGIVQNFLCILPRPQSLPVVCCDTELGQKLWNHPVEGASVEIPNALARQIEEPGRPLGRPKRLDVDVDVSLCRATNDLFRF